MEIFLRIAKWPILKSNRDTQPFSKLPGVVLYEAPDTFLVFIEELRASGHTVLSMFAPGGALAITANKKAWVNLESVSPSSTRHARIGLTKLRRPARCSRKRCAGSSTSSTTTTTSPSKPNCKEIRHGNPVNKISYQPLQVALLLKLLHALSALVKMNPARKVLELRR